MSRNELRAPEESSGARLRAARIEAGMSQEAVAERVGQLFGRRVRQGVYSQWERDENRASEEAVRACAQVFREREVDVTPGWLSHGSISGCPIPGWWSGSAGIVAEPAVAERRTKKTKHKPQRVKPSRTG